jgi:hypothetical protein
VFEKPCPVSRKSNCSEQWLMAYGAETIKAGDVIQAANIRHRTSLEDPGARYSSAYAALRASRISFACRRPRFLSAKMAGRCWARGRALPSSQL